MLKTSTSLLRNWKFKIAILTAIVTPTITATGAYYDLKSRVEQNDTNNSARLVKLELQSNNQYADKATLNAVQAELRDTHDDVIAIKTFLTRKLK